MQNLTYIPGYDLEGGDVQLHWAISRDEAQQRAKEWIGFDSKKCATIVDHGDKWKVMYKILANTKKAICKQAISFTFQSRFNQFLGFDLTGGDAQVHWTSSREEAQKRAKEWIGSDHSKCATIVDNGHKWKLMYKFLGGTKKTPCKPAISFTLK